MQQHKYRNLIFDVPQVSDTGFRGYPPPSRVFQSIGTIWDPAEFAFIHRPVPIGPASTLLPEKARERVLDMPIRFPGIDYRLPHEVMGFAEDIAAIGDADHLLMRGDDSRYCYLTIDYGTVPAKRTPRNPGYHVDGFQGARIDPKLPIDHSYIAASAVPTIFCEQFWNVSHLDPAKHDFFEAFDRQAIPENARELELNTFHLIDAYTVHRCGYALNDTYRIFMRMTYSVRQFDRLGNTHNPMFDYNWEMVPRHLELKG